MRFIRELAQFDLVQMVTSEKGKLYDSSQVNISNTKIFIIHKVQQANKTLNT
jgi:hypothetical protein